MSIVTEDDCWKTKSCFGDVDCREYGRRGYLDGDTPDALKPVRALNCNKDGMARIPAVKQVAAESVTYADAFNRAARHLSRAAVRWFEVEGRAVAQMLWNRIDTNTEHRRAGEVFAHELYNYWMDFVRNDERDAVQARVDSNLPVRWGSLMNAGKRQKSRFFLIESDIYLYDGNDTSDDVEHDSKDLTIVNDATDDVHKDKHAGTTWLYPRVGETVRDYTGGADTSKSPFDWAAIRRDPRYRLVKRQLAKIRDPLSYNDEITYLRRQLDDIIGEHPNPDYRVKPRPDHPPSNIPGGVNLGGFINTPAAAITSVIYDRSDNTGGNPIPADPAYDWDAIERDPEYNRVDMQLSQIQTNGIDIFRSRVDSTLSLWRERDNIISKYPVNPVPATTSSTEIITVNAGSPLAVVREEPTWSMDTEQRRALDAIRNAQLGKTN